MSLSYDLDSYKQYISDDKKLKLYKSGTRNTKHGKSFIPLSLDYDPIMFGLHGGPEWPGGSHDKLNNQIIITNHYLDYRTYHTCCLKNKPSAVKARQHLIILIILKLIQFIKLSMLVAIVKIKMVIYKEFVGDIYS